MDIPQFSIPEHVAETKKAFPKEDSFVDPQGLEP